MTYRRLRPIQKLLVLSGYGIRVKLASGHLCVEDGIAGERRRFRVPRAERELKRLVVLGHSGNVSFDALRWMQDVGISFVQVDSDGQLVATSGRAGFNDARLRRAQATAIETAIGLQISKTLIRQKLIGQLGILQKISAREKQFKPSLALFRRSTNRRTQMSSVGWNPARRTNTGKRGEISRLFSWSAIQINFPSTGTHLERAVL